MLNLFDFVNTQFKINIINSLNTINISLVTLLDKMISQITIYN